MNLTCSNTVGRGQVVFATVTKHYAFAIFNKYNVLVFTTLWFLTHNYARSHCYSCFDYNLNQSSAHSLEDIQSSGTTISMPCNSIYSVCNLWRSLLCINLGRIDVICVILGGTPNRNFKSYDQQYLKSSDRPHIAIDWLK